MFLQRKKVQKTENLSILNRILDPVDKFDNICINTELSSHSASNTPRHYSIQIVDSAFFNHKRSTRVTCKILLEKFEFFWYFTSAVRNLYMHQRSHQRLQRKSFYRGQHRSLFQDHYIFHDFFLV